MRLDFDLAKPIYQQIIDEYRRAIARGQLAPGDRIPSQRELAQQARVNPNTVQRAYREMELMGLIETLRGQGSFIRQDPSLVQRIRREMAREAIRTFISEMRSLGFSDEETLEMAAAGLKELREVPTGRHKEGSGNDRHDTDTSSDAGR